MTYHEILNIIIFNKVKILKVTLISTILLFLILLFVYPVTYQSPVTLLPPENDKQTPNLGSLLSGQDFSSLLTGNFSSANSQLFVEILKSRSAAEFVVKKHNLVKYYDKINLYEAASELSKHLEVEINKEGIIKLSVEVSTSPLPFFFDDKEKVRKFSAALSNSFAEALDKINREKLSSKAKRAREYIEGQLFRTRVQLDSVENLLMKFQEINKTVALPEQLKAAIDAASKLKSEIVKTEIEIGMLQQNLKEDNKILLSLRNKLNELQGQYDKMELGSQDYLLAFREVPELGRELATLLREVKIQNEVYTLLQQQYYKEKIQENRDIPTVEILDEAIPPLKPAAPRVIFSSVMGGIFVFILISLIFILSERKTYLYNQERKEV